MKSFSIFFDGYLLEVSFPLAIVFIVLGVYTVVSNTLVCVVYISDCGRGLRTVSNKFVISLAVADIMVGLLVEPLNVAHYWSAKDERILFCFYIFAVLSCVSSILHICAMMLDRYVAVSRPYRYRILVSDRRVRLSLVLLWLTALHFAVLPIAGWRTASYQIYLYLGGVLLPLGVTFAAYKGLINILKSKRSTLGVGNKSAMKKRIEYEKKISNTVLIMMMAFFGAWCPFSAVDFVFVHCSWCRESQVIRNARDISTALAFASSGINPLLYAWRVPTFRRGLRRLCTRNLSTRPSLTAGPNPASGQTPEQGRVGASPETWNGNASNASTRLSTMCTDDGWESGTGIALTSFKKLSDRKSKFQKEDWRNLIWMDLGCREHIFRNTAIETTSH